MSGNTFKQNAWDRGELGRQWLKRIPEIVGEMEEKWNIKAGEPFDLSYNYVVPVEFENGEKAVLKIGLPDDEEFLTEAKALKIYDGDGIVRLYDFDVENMAMLIERVEPGQPLSELVDDIQATKILAGVIKRLDRSFSDDVDFPHVSNWMKGFKGYRERCYGSNGPLPLDLIERAEILSDHLIISMKKEFLVHGDLHHDNVLKGVGGQWIAIDPKGIIAETEYECAVMLRNPQSRIIQSKNLTELLKTRIIILSEELDVDPRRILDWGIVQTMLSAIWIEEDHGMGWDKEIMISRHLAEIEL
ncbi:MAG: aminoglycoside phosphotransferase family protein [Candidatus Pacebacteria bacterium]|nr:aminoglycoside phosphotransferase family protein [Candidatus Paceibacterota bacterium]